MVEQIVKGVRDVLQSGLNRKNRNQRPTTTSELAMEHAPRIHAWSVVHGMASRQLCHGMEFLVQYHVSSEVVELSPLR
jgi:hypothetical protein